MEGHGENFSAYYQEASLRSLQTVRSQRDDILEEAKLSSR